MGSNAEYMQHKQDKKIKLLESTLLNIREHALPFETYIGENNSSEVAGFASRVVFLIDDALIYNNQNGFVSNYKSLLKEACLLLRHYGMDVDSVWFKQEEIKELMSTTDTGGEE